MTNNTLVKKHSGIATVVILAAASIAALLFLGIQAANQFSATEESWHRYNDQTRDVSGSLNALQRHLGYGGFIHNFKNFILRREPIYLEHIEKSAADAFAEIATLQTVLPSTEEQNLLQAVRLTINDYLAKKDEALSQLDTLSARDLDALVRVDDSAALAALQRLQKLNEDRSFQQEIDAQATFDSAMSTLKQGSFIVIFILAGASGIIILLIRAARINARLNASLAYIEQLYNESPNALVSVDSTGRIFQINRQTERLLGYSTKELAGRSVQSLIPEQFPEGRRTLGEKLTLDAQDVSPEDSGMQLVARCNDGQEIQIHLRIRVAAGANEAFFLLALIDITEIANLHKELHIARQNAEAASEAKSRFLTSMSHEIRTPLNGILGLLQLIDKNDVTAEIAQKLAIAKESGLFLLTLINQILDYSRIEAGEMSLENVEFSAGEVLEKVAETVSSAALAKNVRLVVLVDAQVPDTVRGDALKLRQILINLASNAVRFTARGRVELSLSVAEDDAAVLLFSVRDTGIGIPEDARQRLFERFTRADVATNCRYGGSGLGLSISQGLAELLGGRLELDSELGKGSVFRLCLPCETLKPAKPSRELVGLDVRLCGDDLRELACWGGVLARAGAHVHPEGTGAVAVEVRGDALGARIEVGGRLQIGLSRPIRLLDLISSVRRAADPDQVAAVPQAGLQAVLSGTAKQILPAPAAPAAGCPVDEDMIRSVLGDSPAHRQKVFNEFLRVNGDLLDQLSAAGEAGEIARLRDLAHRMLGSARVLGAGPLIAALESLEDAREGDAALAGQLIAARQAYDALARWLAVELAPAI